MPVDPVLAWRAECNAWAEKEHKPLFAYLFEDPDEETENEESQ